MAKRIIQVPIDEALLKELDVLSRGQQKPRAELIRQACRHYIKRVEDTELDKMYREGYKKIPERPDIGEGQIAVTGEVLTEESW